MRTTLIVLLVVIVIAGLVYIVSSTAPNEDSNIPPENQQTNNMNNSSVPEGYTLREIESLNLQFYAPEEATVNQEASGIYRVRYLGPDNTPNSEITDGFIVTFQLVSADEFSTLSAYAESAIEETRDLNLTVYEPLATTDISTHTAYTYEHETQLGTRSMVYMLQPEDDEIIRITSSVMDPNDQQYASMVETILNTLMFTTASADTQTIQLALLDYEGTSDGIERGCDRVVMVDRVIPATTTPLNAALSELFETETETINGWRHFLASQDDLAYERVTLIDGTASVYLTGELGPLAGVCDNPRAESQIVMTAEQFDTVDDVEIYLNGNRTTLIPDGRGE